MWLLCGAMRPKYMWVKMLGTSSINRFLKFFKVCSLFNTVTNKV